MLLSEQVLKKQGSFYPPYISSVLPWLILGVDFLGFFVSQYLSFWIINHRILSYLDLGWFVIGLLVISSFYLFNTYHPELEVSKSKFFFRTIFSGFLIAVFFLILIGIIGIGNPHRPFWQKENRLFLSIFILTFWSASFRSWLSWQVNLISSQGKWIIFCHYDKIQELVKFFSERHLDSEVDFFTRQVDLVPKTYQKYYPVSELSDEIDFSTMQSCSGILVDPHFDLTEKQLNDLMKLRLRGTNIYNLPDFFERFLTKVPPISLRDHWFIFKSGFALLHNPSYIRIKRLTDVTIASGLILLLSPLMLLTALAIRLDSPGPIFYSQTRTGLNQRPFKVLKFRSMYQDAEARGAQWATQRDPRITRVGRFIRATRIDELPQFLNVLLGSMSMIGPRPERPEFDQTLAEHIPYYSVRYIVRPGITGWAQVMYPYGASIDDAYEKFSYDLYYLKNYSLILDLRIVLKTIRVVLFGKGR